MSDKSLGDLNDFPHLFRDEVWVDEDRDGEGAAAYSIPYHLANLSESRLDEMLEEGRPLVLTRYRPKTLADLPDWFARHLYNRAEEALTREYGFIFPVRWDALPERVREAWEEAARVTAVELANWDEADWTSTGQKVSISISTHVAWDHAKETK